MTFILDSFCHCRKPVREIEWQRTTVEWRVIGWFICFSKATYLPAHQTSVITLQGHVAHTYGGQGELKEWCPYNPAVDALSLSDEAGHDTYRMVVGQEVGNSILTQGDSLILYQRQQNSSVSMLHSA